MLCQLSVISGSFFPASTDNADPQIAIGIDFLDVSNNFSLWGFETILYSA